MATASSKYPEIARMSTESKDLININGREVEYRNTNRLVGAQGWDIGLSKTGYIQEAGRCLIMNIKAGGKNATLVLLNASASSARILDALNIRRFISGDEPVSVARASHRAPRYKASSSRARIKASSGRARIKAVAGTGKIKAVKKRGKVKVVPKRRKK
jgi:D-alanyl-D-alanine carboxypeptidase/D-alanyl-D-alanine endopeptidase (penicillin-binding protein 7)